MFKKHTIYKIITPTKIEASRVLRKLFRFGFVFGLTRLTKMKLIHASLLPRFGSSRRRAHIPSIIIYGDTECRCVLYSGNNYRFLYNFRVKNITFQEFIDKKLYEA